MTLCFLPFDVVSNVERAAGRIYSVRTCIRALLPWPSLDDSANQAGHYGHGIQRQGGDHEILDEQVHRREGGAEPMTNIRAWSTRPCTTSRLNMNITYAYTVEKSR